MDKKRLGRLLEFLIIGITMGLVEDLLAVVLTTDAEVTPTMIMLIILIAIPFAVVSELIVDHPQFALFEKVGERVTTTPDDSH